MKKDLCCSCRKRHAGGPENVIFKFKGLRVSEFKSGMICRSCAVRRWIIIFKNHGSFVRVEKEGLKIDWELFVNCHPDEKNTNVLILKSLGVLSVNPSGNWTIVADDSISLTPRVFINMYFTKKDYAVDYALAKYSNTQYGWEIHRIAEVIKKSGLIKQEKTPPV